MSDAISNTFDEAILSKASREDLIRIVKIQQLMLGGVRYKKAMPDDQYLTMLEVAELFGRYTASLYPFYIQWSKADHCGEWAAYQSTDILLELHEQGAEPGYEPSLWKLIDLPQDILDRCKIASEYERNIDMATLLNCRNKWVFLSSYDKGNEECSFMAFCILNAGDCISTEKDII